jgi:hypothetical protein
LWVRIPPEVRIIGCVGVVCCRPGEFNRPWCVIVGDGKTFSMRSPWARIGPQRNRGGGRWGVDGRMNNLGPKNANAISFFKKSIALHANVERCITNTITDWSSPRGTGDSSASQKNCAFST